MTTSDAPETRRRVDQSEVQRLVRQLLAAIGENPDRDGLLDTPARIARMYDEIFSGLDQDPVEILSTSFEEAFDEMVRKRRDRSK